MAKQKGRGKGKGNGKAKKKPGKNSKILGHPNTQTTRKRPVSKPKR